MCFMDIWVPSLKKCPFRFLPVFLLGWLFFWSWAVGALPTQVTLTSYTEWRESFLTFQCIISDFFIRLPRDQRDGWEARWKPGPWLGWLLFNKRNYAASSFPVFLKHELLSFTTPSWRLTQVSRGRGARLAKSCLPAWCSGCSRTGGNCSCSCLCSGHSPTGRSSSGTAGNTGCSCNCTFDCIPLALHGSLKEEGKINKQMSKHFHNTIWPGLF